MPRQIKLTELLILVCASLSVTCVLADSSQVSRPNVVWLMSEDNSTHFLKSFDEHGAETPHIAELAAHGVLYQHAYSNSPVCSVARTTLITGCYAPRIGTQYHRKQVTVPLPGDLKMFPAYLRQAGYYTANNQKKDYNAVESPDVWDQSNRMASWRGRRDGQPFFYVQTFTTSHESSLHFSREQMQRESTRTDPAAIQLPPIHPDTPTFRYTYARYHDRIQDVDRQIGAVVKELKQDGLLEETFIFYFGDHGGVLPGSKGYANDAGLHVPLVVRIPEKWQHLVDETRGTRQAGFVSFIDFGPTVLHLAGVPVPQQMDGKPFLGPGIRSAAVSAQQTTFGYADRFDEKYDLVRWCRKGRYSYARNYQSFYFDGMQNNYRYKMLAYQEWRELSRAGKLNPTQDRFFQPKPVEALYDLQSDPYETRNLSESAEHADVLLELRTELAEKVTSLPDLSFYPESLLAEVAFADPVGFGEARRTQIAALVAVADLALESFDAARERLELALQADDPWQRYWGLIVCSSFGPAAAPLAERASELAASDPERLVRVRAAEFLGLIGHTPPQPVLLQALRETESGIEAGLILNSVVLLRDGAPSYPFELERALFQPAVLKNDTVQRRLEYLQP